MRIIQSQTGKPQIRIICSVSSLLIACVTSKSSQLPTDNKGIQFVADGKNVIDPSDFRCIDAISSNGPSGDQVSVPLYLSEAGAKKLHNFTATHVGRTLAIVVCGVVVAEPIISEAIGDIQFPVFVSGAKESALTVCINSADFPVPRCS